MQSAGRHSKRSRAFRRQNPRSKIFVKPHCATHHAEPGESTSAVANLSWFVAGLSRHQRTDLRSSVLLVTLPLEHEPSTTNPFVPRPAGFTPGRSHAIF